MEIMFIYIYFAVLYIMKGEGLDTSKTILAVIR